jgi:hypothetical protein
MHKITFYPVGNGDTCKIDLECGIKMIFDYAQYFQPDNDEDLRIDLATSLRNDLEIDKRDYFDVVAFTHADEDHIRGASDFFYLEHAKKYQGEGRIKIEELWVPAAFIAERDLSGDAFIIRAEARHRLKNGKGIRVFSRPEVLNDWLESEGLTIEDRKHLISDAGSLVPNLNIENHGVEFFIHSPFAQHCDDILIDRNGSSLIFHVTFLINQTETRFFLIGDSDHEVLGEIVEITKTHSRYNRLDWDIFFIPHHCSYLALNAEKGMEETIPSDSISWLLDQGQFKGKLISSSWEITSNYTETQPPHLQAANCYKKYANKITGDFIVTMEHPKVSKPEPIIIIIDDSGATLKKTVSFGASIITSKPAPRAGFGNE